MSRFIRINNTIINVDNVVCVRDNEDRREVFMKHKKDIRFTTDKTIDELLEILNAKEQPVDWIPCSDRLPKKEQECLVCRNGTVRIDKFIGRDIPYKWNWTISDYDAWMPLPDPYKGEDNEID